MAVLGLDISHYQGTPNFAQLKADGLSFVFLKATESTGYVDPTLASNRANARAAGLTVGYYHFARAVDATSEANHFCDAVGTLAAGELVALDWEVAGANPPAWCKVWLDTVQARLGVKPLVYMNKSAEAGSDWSAVVNADYGLWLANYDFSATNAMVKPKHWAFVAIEQYSDRASYVGISGGVDADVFAGDAAALARYGKSGSTPVPQPTPVPAPPPPPPAPSFDVRAWRVSYGQSDAHLPALRRWADRMYPAYASTPMDESGVTNYGPQTVAFVKEFGNHVGVINDGRDIGPRIAAALYAQGFRG